MAALLSMLITSAFATVPHDCSCEAHKAELAAAAHAPAEVEARTTESEDAGRYRKGDPRFTAIRLGATHVGTHSAAVGQIRTKGHKDSWLMVEGAVADDGGYMARGGAGFDIFGKSVLDMGLGIVAGHIGDWQTEDNKVISAGIEAVAGIRPGPVIVEHRVMGAIRMTTGVRSESHTRVGYRPVDRLEVFVDYAMINPPLFHGQLAAMDLAVAPYTTWRALDESLVSENGFGGGVAWRF